MAYILDSNDGRRTGRLRVYDLTTRRELHSMQTGYCPDFAISPDGAWLFLAQTDLEQTPCVHEVRCLEAASLRECYRVALLDRALYNIAPSLGGVAVTPDGRHCLVLKTRALADDLAEFSIAILDTQRQCWLEHELALPHMVMGNGPLGSGPDFHFALSSSGGEPVGIGDPVRAEKLRDVLPSPFPEAMRRPGLLRAAGAHPRGGRVHYVSHEGMLVTWDVATGALSVPAPLLLPPGMSVRSQHILVDGSQMYLGVAGPEWDGRGHAEMVCGFSQDSWERKLALELEAPCSKLALDRNGQLLFGLSFATRSLLAVDLRAQATLFEITDVGRTPALFAVLGGPAGG
ncbi:MAG TPA: hypothetical protein VF516_37980 [Kofleriaceae bacterium]